MNVSVCNHNLKPWTPTHQSKKAEKNNLRTQILKQQTNKDSTMVGEGGRWPPILGLLSLDGWWMNHQFLRFGTEREFELHVCVSVSGDRRTQTHHSKDNNFMIITVTGWPKTRFINCSAHLLQREKEMKKKKNVQRVSICVSVYVCFWCLLKGSGGDVNLRGGKSGR